MKALKMYKTIEKQIIKTEKIISHIVCDCCGLTIESCDLPYEWHEITAHYYEGENDSIESYESYLVCSPKCYIKQLGTIRNDLKKYKRWYCF